MNNELLNEKTKWLMNRLENIYCFTCSNIKTDVCENCHKKNMNWSLAEHEATNIIVHLELMKEDDWITKTKKLIDTMGIWNFIFWFVSNNVLKKKYCYSISIENTEYGWVKEYIDEKGNLIKKVIDDVKF